MLRTIYAVMNAALHRIREFRPEGFPSFSPDENPVVYRLSVVNVVSFVLGFLGVCYLVVASVNPFPVAVGP